MVRTRVGFDRFWLVLLALPPLLIFPNLGNQYLWQDEAETALLARSVLRHGIPVAHDGRRVITDQAGSPDVNDDGIWIWTPPLQLYVTAASFALFGESNATARLPFALAGWATILASYAFLRGVTARIFTARLAVLLLSTSVPFLLQLRQCRYYAFVALFAVLHLWAYDGMARRRRGAGAGFVGAGVGLYYTLAPQLAISTLAVAIDAFAVRRSRSLLGRIVALSGVVLLLTLPYFLYTEGWARNYRSLGHGYESLARLGAMLRGYFGAIQVYAWPFFWVPLVLLVHGELRRRIGLAATIGMVLSAAVWALAITSPPSAVSFAATAILPLAGGSSLLVWLVRRERARQPGAFVTRSASAMAWVVGLSVVLYSAMSPNVYFRYLIGVLPWLALATAITVELAVGRKGWAAVALAGVLLYFDGVQRLPFFAGNLVHFGRGALVPGKQWSEVPEEWAYGNTYVNEISSSILAQGGNSFPARYWLSDYLFELTNDYDGPVEATVRYLREHAGPDDVVLVRYEHYPIMYYTDLRVVRWDEADALERLPDWIFVHGFQPVGLAARVRNATDRYELVPLEQKDFAWENIPEPHLHRFWTIRRGRDVRLFRLAEGASRELPAASPLLPLDPRFGRR